MILLKSDIVCRIYDNVYRGLFSQDTVYTGISSTVNTSPLYYLQWRVVLSWKGSAASVILRFFLAAEMLAGQQSGEIRCVSGCKCCLCAFPLHVKVVV